MIATGQYACSASVTAVDPNNLWATAPTPVDPTHIIAALCDSFINIDFAAPQSISVSTLTGFPAASTAA
jgi:hypothetical protein